MNERLSNEVIRLAKAELNAENFREAVDKEKERLRNKRSFWHRVFPFSIKIERR